MTNNDITSRGPTISPEALALLGGGKMRPARHEMNIGATLHEPRAEVAADPSRPHDGNSQRALRSANARSILCPRRRLNLREGRFEGGRAGWGGIPPGVLAALAGTPHMVARPPGEPHRMVKGRQ